MNILNILFHTMDMKKNMDADITELSVFSKMKIKNQENQMKIRRNPDKNTKKFKKIREDQRNKRDHTKTLFSRPFAECCCSTRKIIGF